ncbi:MAG: hormogonium polysaccharide secretion pseudopilin HpsB [Nostoc sp.]|uniref:hormogonium polysaccharide secretion pseudopilin HpsB n=1 Tax=unclassified Nostoc TaxID=2593658 RepID=UPI001D42F8E2|nr:hormogonium polysaccharide secretion pseudopilin HpsB [Nostoc sp. JL34]MBN3886885.1 type II secretion system protein [Nostoc sp. JL34]
MIPHQLQQSSAQSSQSGFTIIESLVAILVVSVLLVAIAPVLVISTATRVQAKRIELATGAAKAFIDAIKSKTISENSITDTMSPVLTYATATTKLATATSSNLQRYLLGNADAPANATTLYCFHNDGKITLPTECTTYKTTSSVQFYIQAFGNTVGTISTSTTQAQIDSGQSYRLGVRVYRSDAEFGSLKKTSDNSGNQKTTATFTGGLGDRKAPLVEMTTEIVRGQSSYNALCGRLGGCQ